MTYDNQTDLCFDIFYINFYYSLQNSAIVRSVSTVSCHDT